MTAGVFKAIRHISSDCHLRRQESECSVFTGTLFILPRNLIANGSDGGPATEGAPEVGVRTDSR
jgi:hypothetical protein